MNVIKIGGNYVKLILLSGGRGWVVGGNKHYQTELEAWKDNYNKIDNTLILRRVRQLRRSGRVNVDNMPLRAWSCVNITWRRPVVKKDDGRPLADDYGAGAFFGNTDRVEKIEFVK